MITANGGGSIFDNGLLRLTEKRMKRTDEQKQQLDKFRLEIRHTFLRIGAIPQGHGSLSIINNFKIKIRHFSKRYPK